MPIARPADAVVLDGFELRVLRIPLVSPFTTSFGTETVREVIVVRALTADGDGWGEIVTGEAPLYSSEYTQGAWDVAVRWLIPACSTGARVAAEDVARILEPCKGHRMAKAGIELAVLDAALRAQDRSLARVPRRAPRPRAVGGVGRHPARPRDARRGRARLPRRGVRAHQAQDQARPRHRRDGGRARGVRAHPAPGRRELGVHARRRRHARRARSVRPAPHRAAAAGGRPRRPRDPRVAPAHARSASTSRSCR